MELKDFVYNRSCEDGKEKIFVEWKARCAEEFWNWDWERSQEIMAEVEDSIAERLKPPIHYWRANFDFRLRFIIIIKISTQGAVVDWCALPC